MSDPVIAAPVDASSLVILRGSADNPDVLLGRRRDDARFMPGYYVFPGGSVDPPDIVLAQSNWPGTRFHAAALRETWEETGLLLATHTPLPAEQPTDDPFYASLSARALCPAAEALHYIARAITPASSPIRFDTRFFLADESATEGTAHAVGELPEVLWVPVTRVLASDKVRGVTKFVLGEAIGLWNQPERLADPNRPIRLYSYMDEARKICRERQSDGLS